MKIVGASFFVLAYLSAVGMIYYLSNGDSELIGLIHGMVVLPVAIYFILLSLYKYKTAKRI